MSGEFTTERRPEAVLTREQMQTGVIQPTPNILPNFGGSQQQFPEPTTVFTEDPQITQTNAIVPTTRQAEATPVLTSGAPSAPNVQNTVSFGSSGGGGGGSNLSSGAVAGVAIACLIIGAALAFAAAFFFFKRRNNKKSKSAVGNYDAFADSTPELFMTQKPAGNSAYVQVSQLPHSNQTSMTAVAPLSMPPHQHQEQPNTKDLLIADILPTAAHGSEVQGRVAALFGQIHRHIETYYRDVHASITPSMESDLARFGAKDVDMAELLQDISSPVTALKHALAVYIISITSPKRGDECVETLFPEELNTSQLSNHTGPDPTHTQALAIHRRLSVFLYTTLSPADPHPSSSTRSLSLFPRRSYSNILPDMREAAEHFSLTFFPWANPTASDQEREDDLTRIIGDVLQMRIWLFGQPGEYAFRWEQVGRRGVVVAPELVVCEEGDGIRKGRERVVLEGGMVGV